VIPFADARRRKEEALEIEAFVTTPFAENCYVLKEGGEALVIDPGEATPGLLRALEGYTVKTLVNTPRAH
jgi:glyoxylase-like metal-dependent hydrolase (beta-lactamase superfamily II)